MRSKIALAVTALLLVTALPALAAPPFGQFGGKVGGGNAGSGMLPLVGWALDDDGIAAVDVLVDGFYVGRASYGRDRPGVTRRHPGYPDSAHPGWAFELDTTHHLNGLHVVQVVAVSESGERRTLGRKRFEFLNTSANLRPWGLILFPNEDAELRGNCNLADPVRRWNVIEGVAFDVGIETENKHGVAWVELMIDGNSILNTKVHCTFSNPTGGLTNCYGLRSDGWTTIFPSVKDSDHAMARFAIDVGQLISGLGYVRGSHRLTLRAGDYYGNRRILDDVLVTFGCDEDIANELSIGFIDQPLVGQTYGGVIAVTGWALDIENVATLQVRVNGVAQPGTVFYGLLRPEITSRYPSYPGSANPGFFYQLDTTALPDGPVTVEVVVTDALGVETVIGERRIFINNIDN